MRPMLRIVILCLLLAAAGAGVVALLRHASLPLRVAVLPAVREDQRALQTLGRDAAAANRWITLKPVPVPTLDAAAKAIAAGDVDVAVLRSDGTIPPQVQTLAILRRDRVFLIVPPKSPIEDLRGLRNQTVAILPGPGPDEALLDGLLDFHGVPPASVKRLAMTAAQTGPAIQQKKVGAVLVVGRAGIGNAAEAFASIARATKGTPAIVGVEDADAVVARLRGLETAEIPKGAFGGSAPDEDVTTVAVAYRIVVRASMSKLVAGELASSLFAAKARLAGEPGVAAIEAPDTEQTLYAIHPGAKAFFDGEQPSPFDRMESLFWILSALIGVIGSAITWVLGRLRGKADAESDGLGRLIPFLRELRLADAGQLAVLQEELDGLVERVIAERQAGTIDTDAFDTYQMALGYARQALDERRTTLARKAPA